jgi:hypothetical protein
MPALPRPDDLHLVQFHKQDISHENLGRDIAGLASALKAHVTVTAPDSAPTATLHDFGLDIASGSGESFRDRLANGQRFPIPEMVVVPEGSVMESHGKPGREFAQPFAVGRYPVTRGQSLHSSKVPGIAWTAALIFGKKVSGKARGWSLM